MKSPRSLWILAVTTSFWLSSGCNGGLTLGPQVRTEYTIVHVGKPMQVLESATVTGRVLDGSGDAVKQDVGGWVFMPLDHWEVVKRSLEKKP